MDYVAGVGTVMSRMSIREAVLFSYSMGKFGYLYPAKFLQPLRDAFSCIGYSCTLCRGKKGCSKMDVEALVEKWIPVVTKLATAHDRDEFDAAEAKVDDLLTPILSAPVKQIREFYWKLLERLKSTKEVPMLVYMGFEAWGEVMIKDAPDQGVKKLKTKLAQEIADLVEEDVKPQLGEAIARALRWRHPDTLKEIKEAVESGKKPKMVGRESCLFLEVGTGKNKKTVML